MTHVNVTLTQSQITEFANEEFSLLMDDVDGTTMDKLPLILEELKRNLEGQKTRLYLRSLAALSLAKQASEGSDDIDDGFLVYEVSEVITRIKELGK